MKILVTGSSGTIGTRLCEKLMEIGHDVLGLDLKTNQWNKKINTHIIDLRDKGALKDLSKDIDLVIHLAANARVYNLVQNPKLAKDNFLTLFNILDFCRENNIKNFIFASSREVYGNSGITHHSEEDSFVKNCESPYTATKIAGEALVHSYNQCYDINFIIIRLSNVYGMYDNSDRIIPLFIKLMKSDKDITIYGKEKLLDFTYIDDAISGFLESINRFEKVKNQTFNISSGIGIPLLKLTNLIKKRLNSKSNILLDFPRTGEVLRFIGLISKANKELDYKPKTNIEEGIKKSIEWYNKNIHS